MAQPLIKFFRVAKIADLQATQKVQGGLYFETETGILYVYNGTAFEAYSGLKSASFADQKLVLTPSVGAAIEIDLSSYVDSNEFNTGLANYVKKEQTIAGIDLQDNITVEELKTALGLTDENLGGEANVLEGVKVNGEALTIDAEKTVNILVAEGSTNGTIAVNNKDVAVHGLGSAAYKSENDFVKSEGYVAYSEAEKTKLAGIEAGAEVNIIEEVRVNGVALTVSTDGKRAVNVEIPDATVKSVKANDKVLKLEGTELSTELSLVYETQGEGDAAKKYIVLKGINDVEIAKIDATDFIADSFLDDVTLDAGDNLQFTWKMADGTTKTDTVNIAKYIDTYTAGNGIDITDKKVSVKIAATSESFLTVDADGVKLSGVQEAINAAVAAKNVTASGDTYVSASVTTGTNHVTVAASETTKASLALADTALQAADITTGTNNGSIAVDGTDVYVKGLGDAAYVGLTATPTENSNDAFTAGGAYLLDEKIDANTTAIGALSDRIDGLDFGVTSVTASTSSAHVTVTPTTASDGAVTVTVDVASVDAANGGAAGLATDAYVREQIAASALTWQLF